MHLAVADDDDAGEPILGAVEHRPLDRIEKARFPASRPRHGSSAPPVRPTMRRAPRLGPGRFRSCSRGTDFWLGDSSTTTSARSGAVVAPLGRCADREGPPSAARASARSKHRRAPVAPVRPSATPVRRSALRSASRAAPADVGPSPRSWGEPLEYRRQMHLIRLVVAGQHVHHEIDAEAVGVLALPFAARDHGKQRALGIVDGPGARPVGRIRR